MSQKTMTATRAVRTLTWCTGLRSQYCGDLRDQPRRCPWSCLSVPFILCFLSLTHFARYFSQVSLYPCRLSASNVFLHFVFFVLQNLNFLNEGGCSNAALLKRMSKYFLLFLITVLYYIFYYPPGTFSARCQSPFKSIYHYHQKT